MRGLNATLDWYSDELVLSNDPNSTEVATIRGSFGETIIISWDCWISSPGPAKRIVVDPGEITFTVTCEGLNSSQRSTFTIVAEAGHQYKATMGWSSLNIKDLTAGKVVAKSKN